MAFRYLWSAEGRAEGRRFVRFITYVAIGGITIGVASLLLSLSVVRGFSQEIEEKIIGFGAHVQVESYAEAPIEDATQMASELAALQGIRQVAPIIQEYALLRRSRSDIDGVALWGTETPLPYIAEHMVEGSYSYDADSLRRPGLVIGQQLARLLNVSLGDRVTAFSMRNIGNENSGFERPRVKQFYVAGMYETSLANYDEVHVFTDLASARHLHHYGSDQVSRFDLTLDDVDMAMGVALEIDETFSFPIMARTIYEVHRSLFAWVNLQESIIPLVIGVIILVAAFNIVGTLLMLILEKAREIGILKGMGASEKTLRRLFLILGLFIGIVGTALGQLLAFVLVVIQKRYEIIPLPAEAYYMETAPVQLNPFDFIFVSVIALVLCVVAAYVPARVAARIEPLKTIHFK